MSKEWQTYVQMSSAMMTQPADPEPAVGLGSDEVELERSGYPIDPTNFDFDLSLTGDPTDAPDDWTIGTSH